jgi:hypothetical protein
MTTSVRFFLFFLILAAGLLTMAVLLDLVSLSEAGEYALRIGGVLAVGFLVALAGGLLFTHKK